ncbi:hypothetical protein S7S_04440 [Isoalcanivorax pacificus W11-5]|uniref:Uncharacterized protein n=1 Tax=Isoalcanivorax pacificus W11-5 TaxID=391936 RepID=A0A0B4XKV0_9GAMM|nr:hypothetical protein [Isoalcanivorax pacificus]AJD47310.1 hypothetical protein S7S_04440 [Isoalcanivorax pacificus W11-5]
MFRLVIASALFALTLGTHAADLTQDTLDRWMAAAKEGQEWSDAHPEADKMGGFNPQEGGSMREQMIQAVEEHPEASRILRRHGFSSSEQWADTTIKIMNAYSALAFDASGTDAQSMQSGLADALAELENNPHIPAEQKQMLRQQLAQSQALMGEIGNKAPEADKALVKRNKARLDTLFEQE